jgi:predicted phage terminase large subunit-like protein
MGKSEIGSRNFPPWVLGQHPDWEIIAASHTASLTLSFSRYIRDVLRDPAYQAVFPDTKLDPSSQSVENWNLTSGGGYLAAGVGTGITGRGAHILLLDDLVKDIEAADSETITENTWEWYGSTAYTRLAPGGGVLGIMTWWSEADWAGRIQETMKSGDGDTFEIVKYPAINDEGDEYILADDSIIQIPPDMLVPEGAQLTRPMNSAVHPARYDTEAMLRIKRNLYATGQRRVWQALYQQNPLPDEGLFFTKDMLRYGRFERRAEYQVFQAWDFAITEKNISDWTVCATLMQTPEDDLILIDIHRFRTSDGIGLVEAMIDKYEQFRADWLGVEDGQIWKSLQTLFEKRCRERRVYPSFEVLTPLTDKMVRAGPLRGRMQMGKFYVQDNTRWLDDWKSEVLHFPSGKHDDQIDATAWAVRLALNHQPKRTAPQPRTKSWKDKLRYIGSTNAGHMAA